MPWPKDLDDDYIDFDDPENVPFFEDPDELDRIIDEELYRPKRRQNAKK